ncbi:hypothetical protein JOC78_000735 [Bacillus ectoiniformans]|nr:hypothetical protein [Bacillus ectoiniformans]
MKFVRGATIKTLEKIDESKWDVQPPGFSNTIKWNAGHIYFVLESFMKMADSSYDTKVKEYNSYFAAGTRPSDWPGQSPSKQEVIQLLNEQTENIQRHFSDRLQAQPQKEITIRGLTFSSVEELLNFTLFHEGLHLGIIQTQNKLI